MMRGGGRGSSSGMGSMSRPPSHLLETIQKEEGMDFGALKKI